MDPHQWEGKAKVTKAYQDLSAVIDSAAGLCIFFAVRNLAAKDLGVAPVGILEYLNAATGADYTRWRSSMQAGERIINAERLFLTRAGFQPQGRWPAQKADRNPGARRARPKAWSATSMKCWMTTTKFRDGQKTASLKKRSLASWD
jgi:aldehyde:ferredoxin oxidoreductase